MKANVARRRDLAESLQDDQLIEKALHKAVRQTIAEHKAEGLPLAVWRDGQVVWMSAEELEDDLGQVHADRTL